MSKTSFLQAKEDYLRTKLAIFEWRESRDLRDFSFLRPRTQPPAHIKRSLSSGMESRQKLLKNLKDPLIQTNHASSPRHSSSEVFIGKSPVDVFECGITLGELLSEAHSFSSIKIPETLETARSIDFIRARLKQNSLKHFTSPSTSENNSPKNGSRINSPEMEEFERNFSPCPVIKHQISNKCRMYSEVSPGAKNHSPLPRNVLLHSNSDEDLDKISNLPYANRKCGTIGVMPTITETPTKSVSAESTLRSLASTTLSNYRENDCKSAVPELFRHYCCPASNIQYPTPLSVCALCNSQKVAESLYVLLNYDSLGEVATQQGTFTPKAYHKSKNNFSSLRCNTPIFLNSPIFNKYRTSTGTRASSKTQCKIFDTRKGGQKQSLPTNNRPAQFTKKVHIETKTFVLGSPKLVSYKTDYYEACNNDEDDKLTSPPSSSLPTLPPLYIKRGNSHNTDTKNPREKLRTRFVDVSGGILCGKKTDIVPFQTKKRSKTSSLAPKNKTSTGLPAIRQSLPVARQTSYREVKLHIELPSVSTASPDLMTKRKKRRKRTK